MEKHPADALIGPIPGLTRPVDWVPSPRYIRPAQALPMGSTTTAQTENAAKVDGEDSRSEKNTEDSKDGDGNEGVEDENVDKDEDANDGTTAEHEVTGSTKQQDFPVHSVTMVNASVRMSNTIFPSALDDEFG